MAKEMIISLRDLSHEVCVAATQESYWHQVDFQILEVFFCITPIVYS